MKTRKHPVSKIVFFTDMFDILVCQWKHIFFHFAFDMNI